MITRLGREGQWAPATAPKKPEPAGHCTEWGLLPLVGVVGYRPSPHSEALSPQTGEPEPGPPTSATPAAVGCWAVGGLPCGLGNPRPHPCPSLSFLSSEPPRFRKEVWVVEAVQ